MSEPSILEQSGTGSVSDSPAFFSKGHHATSAIFSDSPYLRALNRLLQKERQAVAAYARAYRMFRDHLCLATITEDHGLSAREIVRLITLNCGLPDDDDILRLAPERYILQLCRVLPVTVGYAAAFRAMDLLERQLMRRYERILKIAPPSDRVSLKGLLKKTLAHRRELKVRSELP